jgi:hypothetical protein
MLYQMESNSDSSIILKFGVLSENDLRTFEEIWECFPGPCLQEALDLYATSST